MERSSRKPARQREATVEIFGGDVYMNRIWRSFVCAIAVALLLTAFPADGMNDLPGEAPRIEEYDMLPDWFFRVFVAKNPIYFILVEKDKQRLRLLKYDGKLEAVAEYPCATGEKAGKKMFSGDSRTPEGIYFITKIYKDKTVTIFGKQAFHLDFPNIFDRDSGIKGDGIYIHGTDKNLKPMSTNGCIALRNKDLDELAKFLETEATPVMIVSSIAAIKRAETEKTGINRFALAKTLLQPKKIKQDKSEFDCLYLITDGVQTVAIGEFSLYENDHFRIRGYIAPDREKGWINKERIHKGKPLTLWQLLPRYPKNKQEILEFIEIWRKAWQSKDIESYINCYNKSFKHSRMDLAAYREYKNGLNKKYKFIKVDISGVSVLWTSTGAKVTFNQVYRSDLYSAATRKTLHLTFKEKHWGIEREDSFPARRDKRVTQ